MFPARWSSAWLVIARLSVRKQQRRRRTAPAAAPVGSTEDLPVASPTFAHARSAFTSNADEFLDQLADEDTSGIAREELEAALADDGSLWDPLPMTLPTYVNKARARRTVRTIELTGISSSGHSATDTAGRPRGRRVRRRGRGVRDPAQGRRRLSLPVAAVTRSY